MDEWEPFALARDEVMRNRRASKAGAAEWLRQAAVNGEVRVRFAERYYALERSKGARYLALRRTGPRTDEEAEFLAGYTPSDPLDVLRDRPDSMKKHEIKNFTEWHLGDLRAALARDRAAGGEAPEPAGEPAARADRKGVGGAPRQYPWDELGAAFGAWMHEQPGRDQLRPKAHRDALAELAGALGCEAPDRNTARPYLKLWVKGYRAFLAMLERRDEG